MKQEQWPKRENGTRGRWFYVTQDFVEKEQKNDLTFNVDFLCIEALFIATVNK